MLGRLINEKLPDLVRAVAANLSVSLIDVWSALEGAAQLARPNECTQLTPRENASRCDLWSCDRVHLSDYGQRKMAETMYKTLADRLPLQSATAIQLPRQRSTHTHPDRRPRRMHWGEQTTVTK